MLMTFRELEPPDRMTGFGSRFNGGSMGIQVKRTPKQPVSTREKHLEVFNQNHTEKVDELKQHVSMICRDMEIYSRYNRATGLPNCFGGGWDVIDSKEYIHIKFSRDKKSGLVGSICLLHFERP